MTGEPLVLHGRRDAWPWIVLSFALAGVLSWLVIDADRRDPLLLDPNPPCHVVPAPKVAK